MNLTLQLVRKDLRQFRLPALFWAALVIGQILLTNRLLTTVDHDWRMTTSGFVITIYFVGMVVAYLLSGMIVLADAPAGSVSSWQTRPIAGGRLLVAKTVTIVMIVGLLPLLLWLPWWLYCNFGVKGLALVGMNVLLVTLIPALIGAALAAVVDQVGRFMMLTMILGAAIILCAITALVPRAVPPGLFATRLLLDLACVVLTALVAAVVQYRTRRVVKSGSVLTAGLVVFLLLWNFWPVDFSSVWKESRLKPPRAEKISGRVWDAQIGSRNNQDGLGESFIVVSLGFAGVPEDVFVSDGLADVELSWADGTRVRREQVRLAEIEWSNRGPALRHALGFAREDAHSGPQHWDAETQAKYQALKADSDRRMRERAGGNKIARKIPPADLTASLRLEIPVSPAIAEKTRATPPQCRISVRLEAQRPVLLGECPFVEGAAIVHDGRVSVAKLERAYYSRPRSEQLDVHYVGTLTSVKPSYAGQRDFHLIDRAHRTIGWWLSTGYMQGTPPLVGAIVNHPFNVQPPSLWRQDRWVEMPGWQESITFVEIESQPAGSFACSLPTERLEISEPVEE